MPSAHVVRETKINRTFRAQQVCGLFDIPNKETVRHEWNVTLPIEDKQWLVGAIVGPSGSGKTSIAQDLFQGAYLHQGFEWPRDKSVLDGFDKEASTREITQSLSSVGFSSPPFWLKPYHHLSNGQKFRCDLSRCLLLKRDLVIFDEFTSVVDRDVAKVCSAAVAKFIRRRQAPRFIALSCHYDILDWLEPDWVYDVAQERFDCGRLWRRPEIKLEVRQVGPEMWRLFRGHHYLSADIKKGAVCYCAFWNDRPVAFTAVLQFPHAQIKKARREHRTVVLPDFQGVGIGNRMGEFIAGFYVKNGYRYFSTTSHPAMIAHRNQSPLWRMLRHLGHHSRAGRNSMIKQQRTSPQRITASFEYIGAKKVVDGK